MIRLPGESSGLTSGYTEGVENFDEFRTHTFHLEESVPIATLFLQLPGPPAAFTMEKCLPLVGYSLNQILTICRASDIVSSFFRRRTIMSYPANAWIIVRSLCYESLVLVFLLEWYTLEILQRSTTKCWCQ